MYDTMFSVRLVSYYQCKEKMTSFRGQASWAKITSPVGKLRALACHPTKKVIKADELTYISTNWQNAFGCVGIP